MMRFRIALFLPLAALAACGSPDTPSKPVVLSEHEQDMFALAERNRAAGNLDNAADIYRELAATSTGEVQAHLELAAIYRKQRKADEAVQVLRAAQKLQPHNPQVQVALGSALVAANQPKDALTLFDEILAHSPQDIVALDGRGVALDSMGDHAKAQAAYHKGLGLAPGNVALQNNLALSLILSDHYDEAIAILEKLADTNKSSSTIRQNLALAYGLKGNRKRAMELGMKDLSPKEAQENLKFYSYYRSKVKSGEPAYQAVPVAPVEVSAAPGSKPSDAENAVKAAQESEERAHKAAEEKKAAAAAAAPPAPAGPPAPPPKDQKPPVAAAAAPPAPAGPPAPPPKDQKPPVAAAATPPAPDKNLQAAAPSAGEAKKDTKSEILPLLPLPDNKPGDTLGPAPNTQ